MAYEYDELSLLTPANFADNCRVMIVAFDLLLLNGESLMHLPLDERRDILHTTFKTSIAKFEFAEHIDVTTDMWQQHDGGNKKRKVQSNKKRITNVHAAMISNDDSTDVAIG